MMRFPRSEVHQLLSQQFDQIEVLWDSDPYNEVNTFALTIKDFMRDHRIEAVDEGIHRFVQFKLEQTRQLAKIGLANSDLSPRPRSSQLAPQAA